MLITERYDRKDFEPGDRFKDILQIHWHETGKRILHRQTVSGRQVSLRFGRGVEALVDGDLLYVMSDSYLVVEIQPCRAIRIEPSNLVQLASACYEIGNRHLPLYYENGALLMPFDAPVFRQLEKGGFGPIDTDARLLQPLRTTVAPHASENFSLLDRILQRIPDRS